MDGHEFLNLSVKNICDGQGYVLVVARDGGGRTLLLGTDNAVNRLILINGASPLEHVVRAYRTDHFARIVAEIVQQFGQVSCDAFGAWFHLDANKIHAAIAEYDLATGDRQRVGQIERGKCVWVRGSGIGTVKSISAKGELIVDLDEPIGNMARLRVWHWMARPHMREAA